jgi:molybdopterin-guanine dinucleotide biosynthesis protein A
MNGIIIAFIVFVSTNLFSVACNAPNTNKRVYSFLKKTAESASKECPIQVDSVMKLENIVAFYPSTLRYNYTLKYDTIKYDIREFEKSLRVTTLNTVSTSPDSKIFRDLFTTLEYNYNDTLGNFLFRIVITPEDYMTRHK